MGVFWELLAALAPRRSGWENIRRSTIKSANEKDKVQHTALLRDIRDVGEMRRWSDSSLNYVSGVVGGVTAHSLNESWRYR